MITERLKITCSSRHSTITDNKLLTTCPECGEHVAVGWKVEHFDNQIDKGTKLRTFERVLDRFNEIEYYHGIAEMGYDDKIAFAADWNKWDKLETWLKGYFDAEILWHDEWTLCSECAKAIRSQPDSYSWEPSYMWVSDCEILCHECVHADPDVVIDEYVNKATHAAPSWFYPYLADAGFVCYSPDEYCQRFETGFHQGQNDDPQDVAKDIEENLPDHDYIFKINSCGQFDVSWSVYLRKKEG